MTVLNAHYDGRQVVLDDPPPPGLRAGARAFVVVGSASKDEALHIVRQRLGSNSHLGEKARTER
jgi:hypothetical protein